MTAINVQIPSGGTGYMLTDCAILESDGRLQHVANKATSFPHSKAVIAVRGSIIFWHQLAAELQFVRDADDLLNIAGEYARARWASLTDEFRGNGAEFVIMGWSETHNRVIAALCKSASGFEPAFSDGIIAPGVNYTMMGGQTEQYLLALMQEQRRVHRSGEGSAVGGAAILTTITRRETIQRVVHRWPDKIGEPISL